MAICKKLESAQVKCWVAERDISVGEDWTDATRNAIAASQVMVLVLSENANASPHIEREIAHAFYTKRAILPVRLTETPPKRDFLFYLGNVRWFDAFTSPPEQHLEELAANINGMVQDRAVDRDRKLPYSVADETGKTLPYSGSWMGALRASHYGTLEILKRMTIAASLLAAIWLLWFSYSQLDHQPPLPRGNAQMTNSDRGFTPNSTPKVATDSSPSKPTYIYTRLGLWVPLNAGPTPLHEEQPYHVESIATPTPVASTLTSPHSNVDQNGTDEKERSGFRDHTSVKSVQQHSLEIADRSASSTQINKPAKSETEPPEADNGRSLKASPEEQSLKELVLEYLRTVTNNDSAMQERLFAGRVNFFGKGALSFPEIAASMERYRREWPIRTWQPKGEPQFPNNLHSSNPDLYEVLQPFDWTVANDSKHREGSATLYVIARKAANGAFHILHLEQRHL